MSDWIRVGPLDELADGVGLRFDSGSHQVAVFRVENYVYAIGDRCSHAEASLSEGELFDLEIECPRHGSAFDLRTGEPNALPATRPVPRYETKVEEGVVYVSVDQL